MPASAHLLKGEVQAQLVQEVEESLGAYQLEFPGIAETPDIASIVEKTATLVVQQTIDIPRILVVPTGEVTTGYEPFTLDLSSGSLPAQRT